MIGFLANFGVLAMSPTANLLLRQQSEELRRHADSRSPVEASWT